MSTARPFAVNTGSTISGTEQVGNIAVGYPTSGFDSTNVKWWNGPNEDSGYVIAQETPAGRSTPDGVTAYLGFWRTANKTNEDFIYLSNFVSAKNGTPQDFTGVTEAKTWLNDNGYWTSFDSSFANSKFRIYNSHPERSLSGITFNNIIEPIQYGGGDGAHDANGYPVYAASTGWSQTRSTVLTSTSIKSDSYGVVPANSWTFPTVQMIYKNNELNQAVVFYAGGGAVLTNWGSIFSSYTESDVFIYVLDLYRGIFPGNSGFTYQSGLEMNFDFSESSCWDGSSSTVYDIGSNSPYPDYQYTENNDGIQSGGTYNSGDGGYMIFNGTSTHINIGIPSWNVTPIIGFTKQAWIYRNSSTGSQNILSTYDEPFWFNGNVLSAGVDGSYSVVTHNVTTLNQWIHVAVAWDQLGKKMSLFLNGELVNQVTNFSINSNPYDYTFVGSHVTQSGSSGVPVSFFDGRIGEVQYYNFPLDARTILFNYNITKSRYGY